MAYAGEATSLERLGARIPNSIAFFPWVSIDEALTVGPLRLIPYERGEQPGNGDHVAQADIDGVLRAYALSKGEVVSGATLMEYGEWRLGQEADASVRSQLFRARELVAFAALAERRLFLGHFEYCNFDTYSFVVQHYQAGHTGAFSFATRRRDGGTKHQWTANDFAFQKPSHVDAYACMQFDHAFVGALLQADEAGTLPYEAIVEFDRANTDSQDVPTHAEMVLTKSAFEYLFNIGQAVNEFVEALRVAVRGRGSDDAPVGPLEQRWREARPNASRPLEAWAREFCDARGGAAHGQKRGGERFVWSEQAHLAFASILLPLLVKQRLQGPSFPVPERDALELERIEDYLMYDPFSVADPMQHPWNRVYDERVLGEVTRRGLRREMEKIDWANLPKE